MRAPGSLLTLTGHLSQHGHTDLNWDYWDLAALKV